MERDMILLIVIGMWIALLAAAIAEEKRHKRKRREIVLYYRAKIDRQADELRRLRARQMTMQTVRDSRHQEQLDEANAERARLQRMAEANDMLLRQKWTEAAG